MIITGCIEEKPVEKSEDYKPEFSNRTLMAHVNNTVNPSRDYEVAGKEFNATLADVEDAADVYNINSTPENTNELNRKIHMLRSAAMNMQVEEKAYDAQLTMLSTYLDENREYISMKKFMSMQKG